MGTWGAPPAGKPAALRPWPASQQQTSHTGTGHWTLPAPRAVGDSPGQQRVLPQAGDEGASGRGDCCHRGRRHLWEETEGGTVRGNRPQRRAPVFLRRVGHLPFSGGWGPLAATSALGTKQRPGGRKVSGLTPRSASLPDTAVELDGDRLWARI